MPSLLNPYLHFDGKAREAMTFYQSLFGGDLEVMAFGEMGMEGDAADNVMHARLSATNGFVLMGSDAPPGESLIHGDSVGLSLSGDDADELRGWFTALAEGGEVQVPLEKQMWGDEFGQCVDRFGVKWLVNISQPT